MSSNSPQPNSKDLLNQIEATLKSIKAQYADPDEIQSFKLDTDGDDIIFIGKPGMIHSCERMKCGTDEHIVFRANFAKLSMTRRVKRLLRNFLNL